MKTLLALILVQIFLTGCGKELKLPEVADASKTTSPTAKPVETKEEKVKEKPLPKPVLTDCRAITSVFLDVKTLEFHLVENLDSTRDVSCSLTDSSGVTYVSKVHYDKTSDEGQNYFAFCTIYYKSAHHITFNIPGYFNLGAKALDMTNTGFHVSGMPEAANGYDYSPKLCVKQ